MSCGCKEGNVYQIGLGCCIPSIMPADNFYTKPEIDEMLEDIVESGCCITPEQVDEKIEQAVSGKQDTLLAGDNIIISGNVISASGCDLTGYATEQWVEDKHYLTEHQPLKTINNQVISGTGNIEITGSSVVIDPTLNSGSTNPVANSAITIAIDNKLDESAYTPIDISSYAPKVWVQQNFATNATVIQYITNLQQQIDNLEARLEECCSQSGETLYRWVTMTGASDYVCSGTTKMSKEAEEQSTDGGVTWTRTGNYRTGSTVLEYNSEDCGYISECMPFSAYTTSGTVITPNTSEPIPGHLSWYTAQQGIMYTNASAVTAISISECVYEIGDTVTRGVFSEHYTALNTVRIPSGVTMIHREAFQVTSLRNVYCYGTTPATLELQQNTFGTNIQYPLNIYVPAEAVEAYQTAWSYYSSKIKAMPTS